MGDALTHEEIDYAFMNTGSQIIYHPSVMYRRQVVLDLGCYRPEYYLTEDLDLFLRLAEVGRIANLAEPCCSTENISTRSATDGSSSRKMRRGEP